ncbi:RNA-binding S4 domain-containing protein [Aurantimonas sp. C2-6-R+9]|uniref:RNA-binding S4 domain-containing protein n=1 Tax=unclassified Aurantimonas TaxID=2638230 RepID=UPI002E18C346|nr:MULTISPECIES: RNA-binding S4 domain-containing protein [unclassified Aurantimonas]MEC5290371.1 RNA-binding S4 domain-containing protein [Aurantimonas sp. C2-3-R2]MEC5379797.1 RNA-binding S4 domain-containing protein [Aurantimonas sp. C2-6-R+9]MEC5411373.1 RNA-binding S4 domain-containing protein [Aurantimonas sp. C2-4-R8]
MADGAGQRIDKWLFFARVVKSRSLAQKLVQSGGVRINRDKTTNAARLVRADDTLTVSIHDTVRILKIRDCGTRRGPASEAAELYEDLSPPEETTRRKDAELPKGGYMPPKRPPNKKERRAHERLRWG